MIALTTHHAIDQYRSHDIELTIWYQPDELHQVYVPMVTG